jgi:hypothetical protein
MARRLAILLVLAVALAGCGGAESSAPTDSEGVTTVTVATIPTAAAALLSASTRASSRPSACA